MRATIAFAFMMAATLLADLTGDNAGGEGCRMADIAPWSHRITFGPPGPDEVPAWYVVPVGMRAAVGTTRYECIGPKPHWVERGHVGDPVPTTDNPPAE